MAVWTLGDGDLRLALPGRAARRLALRHGGAAGAELRHARRSPSSRWPSCWSSSNLMLAVGAGEAPRERRGRQLQCRGADGDPDAGRLADCGIVAASRCETIRPDQAAADRGCDGAARHAGAAAVRGRRAGAAVRRRQRLLSALHSDGRHAGRQPSDRHGSDPAHGLGLRWPALEAEGVGDRGRLLLRPLRAACTRHSSPSSRRPGRAPSGRGTAGFSPASGARWTTGWSSTTRSAATSPSTTTA